MRAEEVDREGDLVSTGGGGVVLEQRAGVVDQHVDVVEISFELRAERSGRIEVCEIAELGDASTARPGDRRRSLFGPLGVSADADHRHRQLAELLRGGPAESR